jgi:FkbM family methyltransferase
MVDKVIEIKFQDHGFKFLDTPQAAEIIAEVFSDNYKVLENKLEIGPGDVILDLGANEGMFSIMMSKLFPETRIISYEPVPSTYLALLSNIELNSCANITPRNLGVGSQEFTALNINNDGKSGGSSAWDTFKPFCQSQVKVQLVTLDSIFFTEKIDRCRLLKLDIEGGEYDAIYPCHILSRVDNVVAELHTNNRIDFQSRRPDALATWIGNQCNLLSVSYCKMAE